MKKNRLVVPVVKWVGGKRQLLDEIRKYVPTHTTYYEPFLGGGAVLFDLQPQKAVVNDINDDLINLYKIIKDNVDDLIKDLKKHKNTRNHFYHIRELDRNKKKFGCFSPIQKASRIHYLNKTCYNGLFRVNRAGEFNTPFGAYKKPNIVNEITLRAVSRYLSTANIIFKCGDFKKGLAGIRKGSFVYLDPPYDPVSNSANFTGYNKNGFDKIQQERLKKCCDYLNDKGIKFLLSNSATNYIENLYKDYKIKMIKAKRSVNSNAALRGQIDELLIRNYDPFSTSGQLQTRHKSL